MSLKYLLSVLFCLAWIVTFPSPTIGALAKPGCNDTCGNVHIPYPFGIGPGCALNESYTIICTNSSKPFLIKPNVEVLNVSLQNTTVTVNAPIPHFCSSGNQTGAIIGWNSSDLTGTPFFYAKTYNTMMLFGCGNAVLNQNENKILSGCTSTCEFNNPDQVTTSCYGVNCCETTIPFYLSKYHLNLTISRFNSGNCSSAFLADQNWLPEEFSNALQFVPVVLAWTLQRNGILAIYPCSYEMTYLELESGRNVETFLCSTCELGGSDPEQFNPYLENQCGRRNITDLKPNNRKAASVGVVTAVSVLVLIASMFTLYKILKRRRNRRIREKFFKRNGGLVLQQQLSADENVMERTRIFTAKELGKASDRFNENRILGRGGQGTVYKGMLTDGKIVAIKKSKKVDESQLEQFINEVVILSQVSHKNVVKLLGCCLETEVPLLVYEFVPNGTLFSLIHNKNDDEFPFTWNLRLRIATEVAGALAYLHSAVSVPIYHRDIKSSNILLDEKYIAKVSDFGTSMSIAIDKTHLTTLVKGTFGYLDPEYFQSSQFTEKSDVYSFGVVLVELLTRKKPISSSGSEEDGNLSLATRFLMTMDENRLNRIIDPEVVDMRNEEEVIAVAKLAQRCLNLNGKKRPTMKEVAMELENIKLSANHSTIPSNFESQERFMKGESESIVFSDTNPSWTTGFDNMCNDTSTN
ncbi:hypothetical protein ACH5RR_015892 [Cinchona calisaya]|uniref:Protein kinase domain-containing protein n=1 Tax=Cinchona calisaya TaxID=153742 RepID=A0ABD2ZVN2_9GENT